jgi:hypothetical protein
MCTYCKAASRVLDTLWEDQEFRAHFHDQRVELGQLGHLTHEVFVPAYLSVKQQLDPAALLMLEAQVAEDLLTPYYNRPGFREIWDEWDQDTRQAFVGEQSEAELANTLLYLYATNFAEAFQAAYAAYAT